MTPEYASGYRVGRLQATRYEWRPSALQLARAASEEWVAGVIDGSSDHGHLCTATDDQVDAFMGRKAMVPELRAKVLRAHGCQPLTLYP